MLTHGLLSLLGILPFMGLWLDDPPPGGGKGDPPKPKTEAELKAEAKAKAEEDARKKGLPVTQEAIDNIFKKLVKTEEKLERSEKANVGLVGRVADLEKKATPPPADPSSLPIRERYSERSFPKTKDEWDDVYAEDPAYATDLRYAFNKSRQSTTEAQESSRKKIQDEHPDMFLRNEDGSFILNAEGYPQLDKSTKKAQLFGEIAQRSGVGPDGVPHLWKATNGPEMIMTSVMAKLKGEEEGKVKADLDKKKAEDEKKRQAGATGAGVASGGAAPPATFKKVEMKFKSYYVRKSAHVAEAKCKY